MSRNVAWKPGSASLEKFFQVQWVIFWIVMDVDLKELQEMLRILSLCSDFFMITWNLHFSSNLPWKTFSISQSVFSVILSFHHSWSLGFLPFPYFKFNNNWINANLGDYYDFSVFSFQFLFSLTFHDFSLFSITLFEMSCFR